jgi:hypothetical protein
MELSSSEGDDDNAVKPSSNKKDENVPVRRSKKGNEGKNLHMKQPLFRKGSSSQDSLLMDDVDHLMSMVDDLNTALWSTPRTRKLLSIYGK